MRNIYPRLDFEEQIRVIALVDQMKEAGASNFQKNAFCYFLDPIGPSEKVQWDS